MLSADRRSGLRGLAQAALLVPAALAVHELRYLLAFGSGAGAELQRQGHSYLHSLTPWVVALCALAAGAFLRALGRACRGQSSGVRLSISFTALWLACTACLVAIYAGQEILEGLLVAGHPAGWIGIFGYGGWWAIPAAACMGLILAALLHGADWVLHEVTRLSGPRLRGRGRHARPLRPVSLAAPRPAPLAAGWSGRGPPV